jgi:serine/threonine-protein kinase
VRARIGSLMSRLYPAEPSRSRAELFDLVARARALESEQSRRAAALAARSVETLSDPFPPAEAEPKSDDPSRLPGTRYRLLEVIGRGSMGIVYEAVHTDLERHVALKVLAAEASGVGDPGEAFRREARAIAHLSHPNLVAVHEFGQTSDGRPFCAMELVRGETLEQRLARAGALPWRDAVRLAIEACRGLEAAHAAGVLHRDLKPSNMLVVSRKQGAAGGDALLKLLDFGIACTQAEDVAQPRRGTEGYSIVGTPEYMAPEQAGSGPVDARADLYALACVLYESCTGSRPFEAESTVGVIEQKRSGPPSPMRSRARAIPAALDRVVHRALSPLPDERHANAAVLRQALEHILQGGRDRTSLAGYVGAASIGLFAVLALGPFGAPSQPAVPVAPTPVVGVDVTIPEQTPAKTAAATPPAPMPPPAAAPKPARRAGRAARASAQQTGSLDSPQALAEAAAAAGDWPEAERGAQRWMLVEAGAEPRLFLARVQLYAGRRDRAIATLHALLSSHPACDEARAMLRDQGELPLAAPEDRSQARAP